MDGKSLAGQNPPKLTLNDEWVLAKWLDEQSQYLDDFLDDIIKKRIRLSSLNNRVAIWVNKSLRPLYYKGAEVVNPNKWYMWLFGLTEHCDTCFMAHGQVHRLKAWLKAGVLPQGDNLQCGGYRCKCVLTPVMTPRLFGKGNLMALEQTLRKKTQRKTTPQWQVYNQIDLDVNTALTQLDQLIKKEE